MVAEYDNLVGDIDSRFSKLTEPEERKAALRQEVWDPTKTALQARPCQSLFVPSHVCK